MKTIQLCRTLLLAALALPCGIAPMQAADEAKPAPTLPKATNATPATPTPAKALLGVANFESGDTITLGGGPWIVFTDESVGGKSTGTISVTTNGAANSHGALIWTTKLTPDFNWGGFCGIHGVLQADHQPKDLSAYSGVQFHARGDGRKYRVLVAKENIKDGNHFAWEFT